MKYEKSILEAHNLEVCIISFNKNKRFGWQDLCSWLWCEKGHRFHSPATFLCVFPKPLSPARVGQGQVMRSALAVEHSKGSSLGFGYSALHTFTSGLWYLTYLLSWNQLRILTGVVDATVALV